MPSRCVSLCWVLQTLGSQTIYKDGHNTQVLTLMAGTSLKTVPLESVTDIKFLDEDVLADLSHAIDLRRDNRKVDMQKLTIIYHSVDDTTEASLRVRYAMTLDPWTSSYRMMLADGVSTEIPVTLEGHAII